jgi:hypothetical protein
MLGKDSFTQYSKDSLIIDCLAKIFHNPFTEVIQKWEKVINETGQARVIYNAPESKLYNEVDNYAIFCTRQKTSGYVFQEDEEDWWPVALNQATLFTSQSEAAKFLDKIGVEGVVCKINVKFEYTINPEFKFEVLENAIIYQEKKQLEQTQTVQEKAQELKALIGEDNPSLHEALNNYLAQFETKNSKKNKL